MSFKINGLLLAASLAALTASLTADASDFWSPRTASLGGAGHAGPMLNDAIYLNPSFVSLLPTYAVSGNYLFYEGTGSSPDPHGHSLNFSIQDGRSELFQAGAGFTLKDDSSILNIGASKSLIARTGLGVGAKFLFPKAPGVGVQSDFTYSMTAVPWDFLQAAFIVDNLVESAVEKSYDLYREFILGLKFNIDGILLLYLDPHLVPDDPVNSSFGYEMGAEFVVMKDLFLRLGTFRNAHIPEVDVRGQGYRAGLGWIAPRISFDYGFTRATAPLDFMAHTFGCTIYF
jgi:hypothetical protein